MTPILGVEALAPNEGNLMYWDVRHDPLPGRSTSVIAVILVIDAPNISVSEITIT